MLRVTSEIGRLRRALVHEPGPEVDRMVPAMMEELLFDDILYGDRAREEFARFRSVLRLLGVEVLEAAGLLDRALESSVAREALVRELGERLTAREREHLAALEPSAFRSALVAGTRRGADGQGVEAHELYTIPPLPNWCFQRDPQIVLGRGVIFCAMAAPARKREALLARTIFRFHPAFADTPVWLDAQAGADGLGTAGQDALCIEGGDLLVLSPEIVVLGVSERTNRRGVTALCRALARIESGPRWAWVVEIPRRRAYMHLDTLLTQVDHDACLVYPPVILPGGTEQATVQRVDLRSADLEAAAVGDLLGDLARHGLPLEPIPCGGADSVAQQREQWTDGANALALAPGLITLYDRNVATAEALERRGFRILAAEDLLLGREELDPDRRGRVCVLISSHEMSRARGGPHCLVHPLVRDELPAR